MLLPVFLFFVLCSPIAAQNITAAEEASLNQLRVDNLQAFVAKNLTGWKDGAGHPCTWSGVFCGANFVSQLQLDGVGLVKLEGSLLMAFTSLTNLVLNNNSLTSIPEEIAYVGKLRDSVFVMDFSFNQLAGALPASLENMTNLRNLNVSHNHLTGSLPDFGKHGSLWQLDVSHNQLSGSIAASIVNARHLFHLNLENNQFEGSLPQNMTLLGELEFFDVSDNEFSGLLPDLGLSPRLVYMDARNNSFTGQVPPYLRRYTGELFLTGNTFTCPIPDCEPGYGCTLATTPTDPCVCGCNQNGYCTYGTTLCTCNSTWFGSECNRRCPRVVQDPETGQLVSCNGHGVCDDGRDGTGKCTCDEEGGWGGDGCEYVCDVKFINGTFQRCSGQGECHGGRCFCEGNFDGPSCSEACKFGFYGLGDQECNLECPGGKDNPCHGHGDCRPYDGYCDCYKNWEGHACQHSLKKDLIIGMSFLSFVIFVVIVLIIFIVVRYFLMKRYSKLAVAESQAVEDESDNFEKTIRAIPYGRTNLRAKYFDMNVINEPPPVPIKPGEETEKSPLLTQSGQRKEETSQPPPQEQTSRRKKKKLRFAEDETRLPSGPFNKPLFLSDSSQSSMIGSGLFNSPIHLSEEENSSSSEKEKED